MAQAPGTPMNEESYSQLFQYPVYVQRVLSQSTKIKQPASGWGSIIREYAAKNGADPERAVKIAWCESGFKPSAKNSSSTASGLFQFLTSTWQSQSVKYGVTTEKNDPYGQIELATKIMADQGYGRWKASESCWR